MTDVKRYGPWALIVGGSEGSGASFARELAADGFKLAIVARKQAPLDELATELRSKGAEVRTLSVDMSKPDALERVRTITDGVDVGLLIYNAGANDTRGAFVELDAEVYRRVIGLNVIGQTEFTRHYGGLMRQRERGGIILTGSSAGYMGAPTLAPYCAAKAFSRIFTEALWAESRQFGIDVLHLVIGFTATPAMARLGYDLTHAQAPEEVAREGLANLANGPIWIMGGERGWQTAIDRSGVNDRGAAIDRFSTPKRT